MWDDSTSIVTTQQVKLESRPVSDVSSVINYASPSSSDVHQAASNGSWHPYAVLPEANSGKSYPNSLKKEDSSRDIATFTESGLLEEYAFPHNTLRVNAPFVETQNSKDVDVESQDCRSEVHDETSSAHDFEIVQRTLSLNFVPRAS